MSPEIKFRAWDKITKDWFYFNIMGFLASPYEAWGNVFEDKDIDLNKVCRSTTLRDKNGTEIWEGDIVVTAWEDGSHQSQPFAVTWSNNPDSDIGSDTTGFNIGADVVIEVIGNIYENPELLS